MKPTAKTLQEKMGFLDSDLRNPLHDEIVLWAMEKVPKWMKTKFKTEPSIKVALEHPVTTRGYNSDIIVGFIDLLIVYSCKDCKSGALAIEVKPTIPSLGELLRQINTYKTHLRVLSLSPSFYVISPDDRWESVLKSQGVKFIKYTPGLDIPME